MKRFQLLVIVSMITAGVIWMGFYRSRHASSAAVTALLPKDTLALLHMPDFNRSRSELRQTDLYQIWAEPAVQDFLQRPRSKMPAPEGLESTLQECESLQMKDAFVALLTIEHSAWKIVGGFRFKGDSADAEKIVTNWRAKLLGTAPVTSTPDLRADPVVAVPETLDFPISGGGSCTELKVTFRRARSRVDKSARIAIERFLLVP